jgi:hypothetical protein
MILEEMGRSWWSVVGTEWYLTLASYFEGDDDFLDFDNESGWDF